MKLKEKLAYDYSLGADLGREQRLMLLAYQAGFDKARELSAEVFHESWTNKYQGYKIETALAYLKNDVKTIGEEEVE